MIPTTAKMIRRAHQDLVKDKTTYMEICVPMYNATITGDWRAAKDILNKYSNLLLGCQITNNQETPLHIAVMARSTNLVKYFVSQMEMEDLKLRNGDGNTAFCLAVIAGNTEIVDTVLESCPQQLTVCGSENRMPLYLAAQYGNRTMVKHLTSKPNNNMDIDNWNKVFLKCVEVDLLDVALQILDDQQQETDFPQDEYAFKVLQSLAQKPSALDQPNFWQSFLAQLPFEFDQLNILWETISTRKRKQKSDPSLYNHQNSDSKAPADKENEATQLLRDIWKKLVVNREKDIDILLKGPCIIDNNGIETHPSQLPFVAAKMGNVQFLVELIRVYPDLIWKRDDNDQTIFHVAVSHRRESIYSLLYEIGSMKDLLTPLTDRQGNNILHLAGMSAVNNPYENLLTAPLLMQREILWFKEVKAMIPPFCREAENAKGQKPDELFTESHKHLVSESKKWMKETTNQCMVAAVLIATIGFAVVTSIPGGYDQDTGVPHFLDDGCFMSFIIFEVISFCLSSISILMFLSLVVSRYTETEFSESLPLSLKLGLLSLYLSIVTMTSAFCLSFFVVYRHKSMWIPSVILALCYILVLITSLQQNQALMVFRISGFMFNRKGHILYYQNPRF